MALPLMQRATAVWLIENTSLQFDQIAVFCGLHPLEVQAIADGEASVGMVGLDPVVSGQLTQAEIERCEADPSADLVLTPPVDAATILGKKKSRYTPVARRHERPDAIAWFLKYHPEIPESKFCKLLGTTKNMVNAVRTRTHWNAGNIKPKSPVLLGFCSQLELDQLIAESAPKSV
ncbi:MAG: DUF1013 domain-containing protein [Alphaproteobacteria bacterium]|nr:DUF1013 domain-containing protein [Alphaproteobacteria bacterium]